jgi:hypothetical protein
MLAGELLVSVVLCDGDEVAGSPRHFGKIP